MRPPGKRKPSKDSFWVEPVAEPLSPGEHPHTDRRNFAWDDYLRMCEAGEARYSESEFARLLGVSRMELHRWRTMASVPEDLFETILTDFRTADRMPTTTAIAEEIRRRTGRAKVTQECCPNCGHVLRERRR